MTLDGVNANRITAAVNGFKAAARPEGESSGGAFGSLLADAILTQGDNGIGSPYQYIGKLVQNTDSPGAVMAALLGARGGNIAQFALFGMLNALLEDGGGFGALSAAGGTAPTAPPGMPLTPAITNDASSRSAANYAAVISQFNVEHNPRYAVNQKGRGDTYCNIFVWDVTRAMRAEIPHYYNARTGEPMQRGDAGASEMNANAMYDWLKTHGQTYGWREVSAEEAQRLANAGHPVVTALKRPGAHGHVQVVCPSRDGTFNAEKGVTVAQAGSNLTRYSHISDLLGSSSLSRVSYFAHL